MSNLLSGAAAAAAVLLAGCGGPSGTQAPIMPAASVPQPEPAKTDWQIGPWIGTQDYSLNLPLHPTANPDGSFYFDMGPGAEPHYITGESPVPSLIGKTRIKATFRVDAADPNAQIVGANCPSTAPARLTLYFEKRDDDPAHKLFFSNGGRWWAEFATVRPIPVNQQFTVTVPLDVSAKWVTVFVPLDGSGRLSTDHPDWFNAAKADIGRVGFTFGNCGGAGHGAWATSPVRFTVLDYSVE